ncbi:MAG: VWA domain-containing protein [Vicinamibacterales bacterium]
MSTSTERPASTPSAARLLHLPRRPPAAVLTIAGLLVATTVRPPAVDAQAQQRDVFVTVTDKDMKPVDTLEPADLLIKEDGVAREVIRVRRATEPMQIALVVDNTQATNNHTSIIREALKGFVAELAGNRLSVIGFADRPTLLADATESVEDVTKRGIQRLFPQPDSGSYLLDAIVDSTKGFKKQEAPRPVIVAITFEGPEFSAAHHERALEALKGSGAALHVVTVGNHSTDGIENEEVRSRNIVVDRGPRETGGWHTNVLAPQALGVGLTKIAKVLKSQFVATYGRPESLIPPEKLTVSSTRAGFEARGTFERPETKPKGSR